MPAPSTKRARPGSAPTRARGRQQQRGQQPPQQQQQQQQQSQQRGGRGGQSTGPKRQRQKEEDDDEDIPSDFSSEEDDEDESDDGNESGSEEDDAESADQKRLRLAKQYLEAVNSSAADDAADEEEVDAAIENRLTRDVLVAKNRFTKSITKGLYAGFTGAMTTDSTRRRLRGHELSATCVALGKDDRHAFSGSKDCSVIHWDVETGKKLAVMVADKAKKGRGGQVLAVATSSDGKLVASGGRDKLVRLWDARSNELLGSFSGHRDIVTALAFQDGTNQLYTGSADRTVKLWNMTEQAYLDTLYGHQSPILSLDALSRERCLSSAADRSLRLWKIPEDSQLVFNGHSSGNIDTVAMLSEELFLSVSDWRMQYLTRAILCLSISVSFESCMHHTSGSRCWTFQCIRCFVCAVVAWCLTQFCVCVCGGCVCVRALRVVRMARCACGPVGKRSLSPVLRMQWSK
jgi:ribosomal RNA-processing protein 9